MAFEKKPTIAFVDHSFHQKTKCTEFLKDILRDAFSITEYWDDGWKKGQRITAENLKTEEFVLFFQVLPPFAELKKIKAKIIWAPMYDGLSADPLFWKKLSLLPIKILSFSAKVSDYCKKFGLEKINLQYFKNPAEFKRDIPKEGRHVFFWYRGNITFGDLKKHLIAEQIDSFTIISNPDPNYQPEIISEEDKKAYKINLLEKTFETNAPYLDFVSKANIFIAPRKKEGIGMSFLEAMAMGLVVIANNEGTMNEYIENNKNGYLFNLTDKIKIDLSNFKSILKDSCYSAQKGYEKWLEEKLKINDFLLSNYQINKQNKLFFWLDYFRLLVIKKTKRLIRKISKLSHA